MKIRIIAVGKLKEKRLSEVINEYINRIKYDAKLEIIEVKDSNVEEEGKKIEQAIETIKVPKYVFILSEEGSQFDSIRFSEKIKQLSADNRTIVFVIGGPFGILPEVKVRADFLLSLSKMTFTHEMCRLFLLEQIYRAASIIKKRNYHKD